MDDAAVVTKDHGAEMTMTQFAGWMQSAFGTLTLHSALQQAAFLLCCDVIAQDMAKATLRLRERLANGTSRIVMPTEHPVAGLLALEPNTRHTWPEFVEMMGLWGCFTSNAFAIVLRNRVGEPQELIPLQTSRIFERVEGRDVFYDVTASTEQERALLGASMLKVPERDMIHVRSRMIDGMDGYSTMVAGRSTLEAGEAVEDFRKQLFEENGQVRGVFRRDKEGVLDELAFQRLRSQFRVVMQRFAAMTDPIVLEDGLEFQPISSNPAEMELTKQFESQINATCRLLRVPPHKVFHAGNAKYDNLETQEKMYIGDTMVPVCRRFEHRYGKILLNTKDRLRFFFEHDREEMTLKDTKLETERIIRAVERGLIEIDEARAKLGWNPLPNKSGQTRMIPVNMTLVDQNNEVVLGASAQQAGEAEAAATEDQEADDAKATEAKSLLRLVASN